MWDVLLKIAFYGLAGFVLAIAVSWYTTSLYSTIVGRSEVVIAPFEIVRLTGEPDKTQGTALAHMLQARLREIERDIQTAQAQLMGKPPEGRTSAVPEEALQGEIRAFAGPMPMVLTQGVGLQTKLLDPPQIKVSVGGVEVGGVVSWLQRQLVNRRTVVFTLYQKKRAAHVAGTVQAMGLKDDSITVELQADEGEESVALDRIIDRIAYEIVRRRLANDPSNRVEALDSAEFQSLVEVLREAARLNQQVARGHTALPGFESLSERATQLANSVNGWYQLSYLAASIAESAKDWPTAKRMYEQTRAAVKKDSKLADMLKSIDAKLEQLQASLATAEGRSAAAAAAVGPAAQSARDAMQEYVDAAVAFFNRLLRQRLKPPPVTIQLDQSLMYSPYFDGKTVVAAPEVQYLPDLCFRNASWKHIFAIAGDDAADRPDAQTDIIYSYGDVFTMLAHQHHLNQDEKTSDWVLHRGFVDWINGKPPKKPFEGTPYTSFPAPGQAYDDPKLGKDRQVGHMRNYVRSTTNWERRYINSGILNKAFYLVAAKTTTDRAAEIWVKALHRLKGAGRVDFPEFAAILYGEAGDDKNAVRDALKQVGLDPVKETAN